MRLLLIRHGETVDNVAGNYAGITDSALTNHGVLQANRLGRHLADTGTKVAHLFSSDLQRAVITAEAIREAQDPAPPQTTKLQLLREQDFGFYEGKKFFERPREGNKSGKDAHLEDHRDEPGFIGVESKESMRIRVESFIDAHLVQLMHEVEEERSVAVIAHGIILSHLWRAILKRFHPFVTVVSGVQATAPGFSLEYLGGWSNTGYLDLEVKKRAGPSNSTFESDGTATSAKIPSTSKVGTTPDPVFPDDSAAENATSQGSFTPQHQKPATGTLVPVEPSLASSPSPALKELHLVVKAVNSQEHLKGLKKTRGGIGSLKHDSNQKTVDSFFKKRKLEP
ncbi:phosphoglycerate mutase-like protein [Hyaloscypha hepaticicola]|uniref:Phosphoglycerate mutase-like protein n=1 Tax=Hyaloscypha hepaticicola TaxID=2082293 RepID=A0A2J6PKZ5_9HELO|nr:phosphoglycerate mutase-like protein [Hyaloscypha hepaticicola]